MKYIITILFLASCSASYCQWTRVHQLPSSNIFTLFHKDSFFYAGGTNVIYISKDKGQTWDSTAIPQLSSVGSMINHIIIYKNELYASTPSKDIFKSPDGGISWQKINTGIDSLATVTDFCEYRGDLYAATEGNLGSPIFKLDPVSRTHWLSFSNGLSSISTVINSIIGTNTTLVAAANNNALYDYLPAGSTTWEERFLTHPPINNEGAFDIITAHDSLFYPGKTGFFYMSTDNGLKWNFFGDRLVTGATSLVNARQALLSSRYIFDGVTNTTLFYYIKKDSLQLPFRNFSVVTNHFTWMLDILGDKLWDASDGGLFFMSLSDLPGITAAEDTSTVVLPVHSILLKANCEKNKVLLTWKTGKQEINGNFKIEKSVDGIHWIVIGSKPTEGNNNENSYSFTDENPSQNNFYRIVEYDIYGSAFYSNSITLSCNILNVFSIWPNPVHNKIFLNIISSSASQATINIFDSKGALVQAQRANLLKGRNQLTTDMSSFAQGVYSITVDWDHGQMKKTQQAFKQ